MRRLWFSKAALLTPLLGLGMVCGSELASTPAVPQSADKSAPAPTALDITGGREAYTPDGIRIRPGLRLIR